MNAANTLVLGKTKTYPSMKITKSIDHRGFLELKLDKDVHLPYDSDILKKLQIYDDIDGKYFNDVLFKFIEDVFPNIVPEGFYNTLVFDQRRFYPRLIDSSPLGDHQYSFSLDLLKRHYDGESEVHTDVHLTSEIFDPAEYDPTTNGFFPRVVDGKIAPVVGVKMKVYQSMIAMPKVYVGDSGGFMYGSVLSQIYACLLEEKEEHLFFPVGSLFHDGICMQPHILALTGVEHDAVKKGLQFKSDLSLFISEHKNELVGIARKYQRGLANMGIDYTSVTVAEAVSRGKFDYKQAYKEFKGVDAELQNLKSKMPNDLGYNTLKKL